MSFKGYFVGPQDIPSKWQIAIMEPFIRRHNLPKYHFNEIHHHKSLNKKYNSFGGDQSSRKSNVKMVINMFSLILEALGKSVPIYFSQYI